MDDFIKKAKEITMKVINNYNDLLNCELSESYNQQLYKKKVKKLLSSIEEERNYYKDTIRIWCTHYNEIKKQLFKDKIKDRISFYNYTLTKEDALNRDMDMLLQRRIYTNIYSYDYLYLQDDHFDDDHLYDELFEEELDNEEELDGEEDLDDDEALDFINVSEDIIDSTCMNIFLYLLKKHLDNNKDKLSKKQYRNLSKIKYDLALCSRKFEDILLSEEFNYPNEIVIDIDLKLLEKINEVKDEYGEKIAKKYFANINEEIIGNIIIRLDETITNIMESGQRCKFNYEDMIIQKLKTKSIFILGYILCKDETLKAFNKYSLRCQVDSAFANFVDDLKDYDIKKEDPNVTIIRYIIKKKNK